MLNKNIATLIKEFRADSWLSKSNFVVWTIFNVGLPFLSGKTLHLTRPVVKNRGLSGLGYVGVLDIY